MAALRKSPVGAAFMRPWRIHTPPDFIRDQGAINGAPTRIPRILYVTRAPLMASLRESPVGAAFMRPWRIRAALAYLCGPGVFMRPWRAYSA